MIDVIYFSCGRDRELLDLSIESLRRYYPINKIFIADDISDPVGEMEGVELILNDNSQRLLGLRNIRGMIEMFGRLMEDSEADYLLKIDSDVLVSNGLPLETLKEQKPYAYGCNPLMEYYHEMLHGGAYFLSKQAVMDLQGAEFPSDVHTWKSAGYPEDITISLTLRQFQPLLIENNACFNHGGTFFGDTFLTDISMRPAEEVRKVSFVHCRNNAFIMKTLHKKIYG